MGVYLKGMEMPTDCTECWFRKTARHEYLLDCQICPFTGDITPYTKRKDDCPLVPVPPHGDLIERKAAYDSLLNGMVMTGYQSRALDCISGFYVPTIIEAEEGE